MPSITGSFAGRIMQQSAIPLSDQPEHQMSIAEVNGTQKSADPLWDNARITYWGMTDLLGGTGTQRGYFNNIHADGARDWGTFEGRVNTSGGTMIVEGDYKHVGGDGRYRGITGSGKFKTVLTSETEIEASWEGRYELAQQARAR